MIRHSVGEFLQTRKLFVLVLALGLFVLASRNVTDPDVWWHLRTGEMIVQTHHAPHFDPYSYTRAGQPWIDHEWLSEVLIYLLLRAGGWSGLIMFFAAVVAAAHLLAFARSPGKPYVAGVVTLLGAFTAAPSWGVRPQMLTLLLASLVLWLLERSHRTPRLVWWMVPLTLLWANLHAGWALGIGFGILFAMGEALDAAFGFRSWTEVGERLRRLIPVLVLSLAVVAINPYGARLYAYPFQTLHSRTMLNYISEWAAADFHQARYAPLGLMILGTVLLPALSPRRLAPRELLLLAVVTYAALRSVRHIPIYVLVAVPILSATLTSWMEERKWRWQELPDRPLAQSKAIANAILLVIFVIFVAVRIKVVTGGQSEAEAKEFPTAAVSFLRASHLPGPMLNHYNWGGYLIWQLYPEYKVFIDGRADVYGDDLMDERYSLYWVQRSDWQKDLESRDIRLVVLPPDAPLVTALREAPDWKQAYADAQAVVLARQP
jgi:hypothetical protein